MKCAMVIYYRSIFRAMNFKTTSGKKAFCTLTKPGVTSSPVNPTSWKA
jgi:hypothetical protein